MIEPKMTNGVIDKRLKTISAKISLTKNVRSRPYDVINCGKVLQKVHKRPVFQILVVLNQKK